MKRRVLIVAVFVLAGAVVNVAVAWGVILLLDRGDWTYENVTYSRVEWPRDVPDDWPQADTLYGWKAFGFRRRYYEARPDRWYLINITRAGWPCLSLEWEIWDTEASWVPPGGWHQVLEGWERLPVRPSLARSCRQHDLLRRPALAADSWAVRAATTPSGPTRPLPCVRVPDGRVGGLQRVRRGAAKSRRGLTTRCTVPVRKSPHVGQQPRRRIILCGLLALMATCEPLTSPPVCSDNGIDAGDNTAVPVDITIDLDGNPRFVDDPGTPDTGFGDPPVADMGPYEFQGLPCPWDLDGDGSPADFDGDCSVGILDLLILLRNWG